MAHAWELADGSHVVITERVPPNVEEQLGVWCLVPDTRGDDVARDPSVWNSAIDAGPLIHVVYQGVVGNGAWAAFPAAAAYLRARLGRRDTTLDAVAVAERVRHAAAATSEGAADEFVVEWVERDGDGVWRATVRDAAGRSISARLDPSGTLTHLRTSRPPDHSGS